ncbi:porin [Pontibaca salina]|uniref:Porin n=1 Tax=Pontibaca salina TaxID=2795731 RepID=A0A934HK92_9RHOB|nr:porin [Pontibaca salina]MBI6629658.1 porin [Pontibaca salina]
MKKVLFATTALIATAGMAAADVTISGYGRFGLDYNDANATETNLTSRLRLQFDMSTETDGGVTLGARLRAQADNTDGGTARGASWNGARFFATYGGFTLGVGNIFGGLDNAPGLYLETRSTGTGVDGMGFNSLVTNVNGGAAGLLDEYDNYDQYSSKGAGQNGVEVLYSAGDFSGQLSYSKENSSDAKRTAGHVAYTWNDWTAVLGGQDSNQAWEDKVFFAVMADLGQYGVRFAYADNDGIDKYGLYGNMDIGAASNVVLWVTYEDAVSAADVTAGRFDNSLDGGTKGTSYGINYSYDLGGGASFEAGAAETANDQTQVQAGVAFSF